MKIKLISPEDGAVTEPLQKYSRTLYEQMAGAELGPIDWENLHRLGEDRSLPAPARFSWEAEETCRRGVRYTLVVSESPDLKDPVKTLKTRENTSEILHLHVGKKYYWTVEASGAKPPVNSFITSDKLPRWIQVPGITNVRDIGGWPLAAGGRIRQGMAYRGSEMNRHLRIKRKGIRVLLEELKIRTDLDLRKQDAAPALSRRAVNWVNIPVFPYSHITTEEQKNAYRRVFEIFSDVKNYPVFFHCWGGADRAGTAAFLLHALLGVEMEDLIRDYELTSFSIWGPRSGESEEFKSLLSELEPFAPGAGVNTQAESYLIRSGLKKESIDSIRSILTDPG